MSRPTIARIMAANPTRQATLPDPTQPGCYKCREHYSFVQRAHIVARADGGSDQPDNFWLLCPLCHNWLQPEFSTPERQEAWLAAGPPTMADLRAAGYPLA